MKQQWLKLSASGLFPVLIAVAGIGVLSAMDAVIKHLGQANSPLAVTFLRYVFGLMFAAAPLLWRRPVFVSREAVWANAPRGLVIAITAAAFFWSLSVLGLAEAIALTFVAPLLIPPMAQMLLKETMRKDALIACALGFAGVLIAVQGGPPAQVNPLHAWGVGAALLSAVTYALSSVLLRARAAKDGPFAVGLMGNIWPALFLAGPVLVLRPAFEVEALPWMALVGAMGAGGLLLLTLAYARAEAQVLAAMEYTALGWATLFGFVLFHETPRWQTMTGAVLIAGVTLWSGWRSRKAEPIEAV
ncbi:MAG: DMT family transporter [Caulobacteraceae bacterium]